MIILGLLAPVLAMSIVLPSWPPHAPQIPDIPEPTFEAILKVNNVWPVWHVEQIGFEQEGKHWEVDAYLEPRQIEPDLCVAKVRTFQLDLIKGGYAPAYRIPTARRMVALDECERAFSPDNFFAPLNADLSDGELKATIRLALSLIGDHEPDARVVFESDDLRKCLRLATVRDLFDVSSRGSHVEFTFVSRDLRTALFGVEVDPGGIDAAKVYEENGPDLVPAK